MDPERRAYAARKGGRIAHAYGTAHEWTSDEARVAGLKSIEVRRRKRGEKSQEEVGS